MSITDPAPDYVALRRLYESIDDKTSECARRLARVLEGRERPPTAQESGSGVITHRRPVRPSEAHVEDTAPNWEE